MERSVWVKGSGVVRRGAQMRRVGACLRQLDTKRRLRGMETSFTGRFGRISPTRVVRTRRRLLRNNAPLRAIRGLYSIRTTLFHNTADRRGVTGTRGTITTSMGRGGLTTATTLAKVAKRPLRAFAHRGRILRGIVQRYEGRVRRAGALSPRQFKGLQRITVRCTGGKSLLCPRLGMGCKVDNPSSIV